MLAKAYCSEFVQRGARNFSHAKTMLSVFYLAYYPSKKSTSDYIDSITRW